MTESRDELLFKAIRRALSGVTDAAERKASYLEWARGVYPQSEQQYQQDVADNLVWNRDPAYFSPVNWSPSAGRSNKIDKLVSRFYAGRDELMPRFRPGVADVARATATNAGYEVLKKLSMDLGLDYVLGKGATGHDRYKLNETTSPASLSNVLAAQTGIMSKFFFPENEDIASAREKVTRLKSYLGLGE